MRNEQGSFILQRETNKSHYYLIEETHRALPHNRRYTQSITSNRQDRNKITVNSWHNNLIQSSSVK